MKENIQKWKDSENTEQKFEFIKKNHRQIVEIDLNFKLFFNTI